ncbi:hypothetical protein TNCV_1590011 [Trichonephila clavipes]|uniref:Uncharacterized protein n=1 Tax=Trichonephila clavipes TaxID=2585209 RepID=A0A8X6RNZ2_TRICX|nr:hypothetical protein TNCV_1590011 [Trichonephila clavipes]
MVLKANDRRTSCPCHDEFRGPRSDYVRQKRGEGRKAHSGYLPFRTNASTLPITPKRSSSRDVGTSSYRHHTTTGGLIESWLEIGERRYPVMTSSFDVGKYPPCRELMNAVDAECSHVDVA